MICRDGCVKMRAHPGVELQQVGGLVEIGDRVAENRDIAHRSFAQSGGHDGGFARCTPQPLELHVKPELDDVAFLHHVLLALAADSSRRAGRLERAELDVIVVRMISARMKPRSMSPWIFPAACGAFVPFRSSRPGFLLTGGQERHQAQANRRPRRRGRRGRCARSRARARKAAASASVRPANSASILPLRTTARPPSSSATRRDARSTCRIGFLDLRLVDVGDVEHRLPGQQERVGGHLSLERVPGKAAEPAWPLRAPR